MVSKLSGQLLQLHAGGCRADQCAVRCSGQAVQIGLAVKDLFVLLLYGTAVAVWLFMGASCDVPSFAMYGLYCSLLVAPLLNISLLDCSVFGSWVCWACPFFPV